MNDGLECIDCKEPLPKDFNDDPNRPCPKCGSTRRNFNPLIGTATITVRLHAPTIMVETYPRQLLDTAQKLIDGGQFSIAIITSHMAAEIAADRCCDAAYKARGLGTLGDAIDGLLNGHNLGNDKILEFFNVLTGLKVQQEPFWCSFKNASTLRNKIVHDSHKATKLEAEAALMGCTALISFLKQLEP